jgi:hypothetical protein
MIIKLTLLGLILILFSIIAMSYYSNKEGFDDISNGYFNNLSNNLSNATNTVSSDTLSSINDNSQSLISQKQQASNGTIPVRTDVVPEVSISGSGYNAMNLQQKAELLKDIQKVVRNEILANRNTTPVTNNNNNEKSTDSTSQGKEYENSCHKDTEYRCPKNPDGTCPSVPDMSEYIKKDSIPCFGCSLDY